MWELITSRGRLLRGIQVRYEAGELRVSWARMAEGEEVAVLLDRAHSQARVYAPLDVCKELALQHGYELVLPRREGESLVEHIERFLGLRKTAEPKEASRRERHDGHGGVADAGECQESGSGSPARAR
jgi:hypothetical protein